MTLSAKHIEKRIRFFRKTSQILKYLWQNAVILVLSGTGEMVDGGLFVHDFDTKLFGFVELTASACASDKDVGVFGNGSRDFRTNAF